MGEEHQTPNRSHNSTYLGSTQKRAQRPFTRRTWDLSPKVPSSPFRRLTGSARKQSPARAASSPQGRTPAKHDADKSDELMSWIASIKYRANTALEEDVEEERSFYQEIEKEKRQIEAQNQINTEAFEKLGLLLDKEHVSKLVSQSNLSAIEALENVSSDSEENDLSDHQEPEYDNEQETSVKSEQQYPQDFGANEQVDVLSIGSEEEEEEEEDESSYDEQEEASEDPEHYYEGEEEENEGQYVGNQDDDYDSEGNVVFPDDSQLIQLPSDSEHEIGKDEEIEIPKYDAGAFAEAANNEYVVTSQYQSAYAHRQPQISAPHSQEEYYTQRKGNDREDSDEENSEDEIVDLSDVDEDEIQEGSDNDDGLFGQEGEEENNSLFQQRDHEEAQGEITNNQQIDNDCYSFDMLASAALSQLPQQPRPQTIMQERVVDFDSDDDVLNEVPEDDSDSDREVLQEDSEDLEDEYEDQQDLVSEQDRGYQSEQDADIRESDNKSSIDVHHDVEDDPKNYENEIVGHEEVTDNAGNDDLAGEPTSHAEVEVRLDSNKDQQSDAQPITEITDLDKDILDEEGGKFAIGDQEYSTKPSSTEENKLFDKAAREEEQKIYEEEQYYDSDNEPFRSPSHSMFGSLTVDEVSAIQNDEDDTELDYGGVIYNTNSILDNVEDGAYVENQKDDIDEERIEPNEVTDPDPNIKEDQSPEKEKDDGEEPERIKFKTSFASFSSLGGLNNSSTISFKEASLDFAKALSKENQISNFKTIQKNEKDEEAQQKPADFDLPEPSDHDDPSEKEDQEQDEEASLGSKEDSGILSSMLEQSLGETPESFIDHTKKEQEQLIEQVSEATLTEAVKEEADKMVEKSLGEEPEQFIEKVGESTPVEAVKEEADRMVESSLGEEPEQLVDTVLADPPLKEAVDDVAQKALGEEPESFVEKTSNNSTEITPQYCTATFSKEESIDISEKIEEGLNKLNAAAQANKENEGKVFSERISEVASQLIEDAGAVTKDHVDLAKIKEAAAHDDTIFSESIPNVAQDLAEEVKEKIAKGKDEEKEDYNELSIITNAAQSFKNAITDVVKKAEEEVEEAIDNSVVEPLNEGTPDARDISGQASQATRENQGTETQEDSDKEVNTDFDLFIPDLIRESYLQGIKVAKQIEEQGQNFIEEPAKPKLNMSFYNKNIGSSSSFETNFESQPIPGSSKDLSSQTGKLDAKEARTNYEKVKAGIESLHHELPDTSAGKKRKLDEIEPTGIFHKLKRFASFGSFGLGSPKKPDGSGYLEEEENNRKKTISDATKEIKNAANLAKDLVEEDVEAPVSSEPVVNEAEINLPQVVEDFAHFASDKIEEAVEEPVKSLDDTPAPRENNESLIDVTQEVDNFVSFVENQVEEFVDSSIAEQEVDRDGDENKIEFHVPSEVKDIINAAGDKVEEAVGSQVDGEDINVSNNEGNISIPEEAHALANALRDKVEEAVENEVDGEDINRSNEDVEIKVPDAVKEAANTLVSSIEETVESPVEGLEAKYENSSVEHETPNAIDVISAVEEQVEEALDNPLTETEVNRNDDEHGISEIANNHIVNRVKEKVEEAVENPVSDNGEDDKETDMVSDDKNDGLKNAADHFVSDGEENHASFIEEATEVLEKAEAFVEEAVENPFTTEEVNRDGEEAEIEIPHEVRDLANEIHDQVEEAIENPFTESEVNRSDSRHEVGSSEEGVSVANSVKDEAEKLSEPAEDKAEETSDAPAKDETAIINDNEENEDETEIVENKQGEDDGTKKDEEEQQEQTSGSETKSKDAVDASTSTPAKPPKASRFAFSKLPPQQPYRSPFKRVIDFVFRRGNQDTPSSLRRPVILDSEEIAEMEVEEPVKKRQRTQPSKDFHDHIVMKTRSGKIVGANTKADIEEARALEKEEDDLIDRIAHGKIHAGHAVHDVAVEHERIEEHHDLEGNHIGKEEEEEKEVTIEKEKEETSESELKVEIVEPKSPKTPRTSKRRTRGRSSRRGRKDDDEAKEEESKEEKEGSVTPNGAPRSKTKSRTRKELPPKSERKLRTRTKRTETTD